MGQKVMFEATQSVVSGNEVQVPSGHLYASMDEVPEYVQVRPVIVDVPDPKAADKPSAKTQAKA